MHSYFMCNLDQSRFGNDSYAVGIGQPKCVKVMDMEHVHLTYTVWRGNIPDVGPIYDTVANYTITGGNMDVNYTCSGVLYGKDEAALGCWLV